MEPQKNHSEGDANVPAAARLGRRAMVMAEIVRTQMAAEGLKAGAFLPSERELARRHGMNKNTVRRALKAMERDGLVEVVPRHGYRVTAGKGAHAAASRLLLAYVPFELQNLSAWGPTPDQLLLALRQAASRHGWSLLTTAALRRSVPDIVLELRSIRVSGVVLDGNASDELIGAVHASGIPLVLADNWRMQVPVDSVMQDGEMGGLLAVQHLLQQGCRHPAWFGMRMVEADGILNVHRMDRFNGACAGMELAGMPFKHSLVLDADIMGAEKASQALFQQRPRPDGVVALWTRHAMAVAEAARAAGVRLGQDLHLVGWCMEEAIDSYYRPAFQGGPIPPCITWSARTMAEVAVNRLGERIRQPDLPVLRIKTPVRLVIPE